MMDYATLSAAWNKAGRAFFLEYAQRLARFYGDGDQSVNLDADDPRNAEQGEQVLRAVIELNAQNRWERARELFDPAYAPLFPHIQANKRALEFVTILGPDELLVRRGSPWQRDGVTFHLRGGRATPVPGVHGMARSRNRNILVLAREEGLEVRNARAPLESPALDTLPWPDPEILKPRGLPPELAARWKSDDEPLALESLHVSDDGLRIALSAYRQGILLASRSPNESTWQLLLPDARPPYNWGQDFEPDEEVQFSGDMTHCAMSPDGTRLAYGEQSSPHYLAEVLPGGEVYWYATVGNFVDYPHNAWFSDDGAWVALNSCHFYNGATLAFDWNRGRGVELKPYAHHELARVCDDSLRVYASCWSPSAVVARVIASGGGAPSTPVKTGAFLLAGSGLLRCVLPDGRLLFAQAFGSSASSIDYCPEAQRVALGSYSGMVHVYDVMNEELPGRIDGWRARREIKRWLLWEDLPNGPIAW